MSGITFQFEYWMANSPEFKCFQKIASKKSQPWKTIENSPSFQSFEKQDSFQPREGVIIEYPLNDLFHNRCDVIITSPHY